MRILPNGGKYERQVVHIEAHNGMKPEIQSLTIKKLKEDFDADYIALDRSGVGASVWSELQKVQSCPKRGIEYPAYTSMNDDNTVDKIAARGSLPIVYTIANPTTNFNNDIAVGLLSAFEKKNKLKLLIDHLDARTEVINNDSSFVKKSPEEQARYLAPFVQTTALVNELINLEYSLLKDNIRISEKGNARKDRYSSLAYCNYLANLLEEEEMKKRKRGNSKMKPLW